MTTTRTSITKKELRQVLADHRRWFDGRYVANYGRADLSHRDLRGINLSRQNLGGALFCFADLSHAVLYGAEFVSADFTGATLHGTDLRGADLTNVFLQGASMVGADLRDAVMSGTYLQRADLTGARGLTGARLLSAHLDETAFSTLLRDVQMELMAQWALKGSAP